MEQGSVFTAPARHADWYEDDECVRIVDSLPLAKQVCEEIDTVVKNPRIPLSKRKELIPGLSFNGLQFRVKYQDGMPTFDGFREDDPPARKERGIFKTAIDAALQMIFEYGWTDTRFVDVDTQQSRATQYYHQDGEDAYLALMYHTKPPARSGSHLDVPRGIDPTLVRKLNSPQLLAGEWYTKILSRTLDRQEEIVAKTTKIPITGIDVSCEKTLLIDNLRTVHATPREHDGNLIRFSFRRANGVPHPDSRNGLPGIKAGGGPAHAMSQEDTEYEAQLAQALQNSLEGDGRSNLRAKSIDWDAYIGQYKYRDGSGASLKRQNVAGDGACFFRCMAFILTGNEGNFPTIIDLYMKALYDNDNQLILANVGGYYSTDVRLGEQAWRSKNGLFVGQENTPEMVVLPKDHAAYIDNPQIGRYNYFAESWDVNVVLRLFGFEIPNFGTLAAGQLTTYAMAIRPQQMSDPPAFSPVVIRPFETLVADTDTGPYDDELQQSIQFNDQRVFIMNETFGFKGLHYSVRAIWG